jgi:hypothetical protein
LACNIERVQAKSKESEPNAASNKSTLRSNTMREVPKPIPNVKPKPKNKNKKQTNKS